MLKAASTVKSWKAATVTGDTAGIVTTDWVSFDTAAATPTDVGRSGDPAHAWGTVTGRGSGKGEFGSDRVTGKTADGRPFQIDYTDTWQKGTVFKDGSLAARHTRRISGHRDETNDPGSVSGVWVTSDGPQHIGPDGEGRR